MINWATISLFDFAGYVSEELRKRGMETILVGGACATIYSKNRYQSYDLDYITYDDMKNVRNALKDMEFIEKQKYFQHENCPWFIEFVSPPVAVGNEPIREFNTIKTSLGTIKLLRAVDSVKDRLAAYYHWGDQQGLKQAINICQEQDVNIAEVRRWSAQEDQQEKFKIFIKELKKKLSEDGRKKD